MQRVYWALAGVAWLALAAGNRAEALIAKPPVQKNPVEVKLVAKTDAYVLDLGGKTAKEYAAWIKELHAKGKPGRDVELPKPPAVNLAIEFTNTGKENVTIYVGGDYTLELKLEGPAAYAIDWPAPYTTDIKRPTAVTLEPGKTHSIPIKQLEAGFRGYGTKLYWAEPGEYTLTATYSVRGQPAEDSRFTAGPVKLKVELPKAPPAAEPPLRILPVEPPAPPKVRAEPGDKEPAKKLLELTFVVKKGGDKFQIDAREAAELRKEIEAALEDAKNGRPRERIPPAPSVQFELVIKNVSDKDVDIYVGGDDTRLSLELKGPGAIQAGYLFAQTADFRLSKRFTLKPGETFTQEITTLEHGPRGRGSRWYWTQAGEYTLTATWQLGGPQGKPGEKLQSPPLKIIIEEKK